MILNTIIFANKLLTKYTYVSENLIKINECIQ